MTRRGVVERWAALCRARVKGWHPALDAASSATRFFKQCGSIARQEGNLTNPNASEDEAQLLNGFYRVWQYYRLFRREEFPLTELNALCATETPVRIVDTFAGPGAAAIALLFALSERDTKRAQACSAQIFLLDTHDYTVAFYAVREVLWGLASTLLQELGATELQVSSVDFDAGAVSWPEPRDRASEVVNLLLQFHGVPALRVACGGSVGAPLDYLEKLVGLVPSRERAVIVSEVLGTEWSEPEGRLWSGWVNGLRDAALWGEVGLATCFPLCDDRPTSKLGCPRALPQRAPARVVRSTKAGGVQGGLCRALGSSKENHHALALLPSRFARPGECVRTRLDNGKLLCECSPPNADESPPD